MQHVEAESWEEDDEGCDDKFAVSHPASISPGAPRISGAGARDFIDALPSACLPRAYRRRLPLNALHGAHARRSRCSRGLRGYASAPALARPIFFTVMFTYIDPTVRARLIAQKKLRRINEQGHEVDVTSPNLPDDPALEVMGPIPMPIDLTGEDVLTQWYPFVRRTELAGALDLAEELRQRDPTVIWTTTKMMWLVSHVAALVDLSGQ